MCSIVELDLMAWALQSAYPDLNEDLTKSIGLTMNQLEFLYISMSISKATSLMSQFILISKLEVLDDLIMLGASNFGGPFSQELYSSRHLRWPGPS